MRTANPTNAASGTRKACPGKSAGYSDLAGLPIRKRACNRLIQFKKLISFQAFGCQGSILGNFFAFVFLRLTCLTELVGYQLRTHFFIFSPPKRRTQNPVPHSQPPDCGAFFLGSQGMCESFCCLVFRLSLFCKTTGWTTTNLWNSIEY